MVCKTPAANACEFCGVWKKTKRASSTTTVVAFVDLCRIMLEKI